MMSLQSEMLAEYIRKSFLRNLLKLAFRASDIRLNVQGKRPISVTPNAAWVPSWRLKQTLSSPNQWRVHYPSLNLYSDPKKYYFCRTEVRNLCSEAVERRDDGDSDDELYRKRDSKEPPRLFVVQPRLRPDSMLQAKLLEAIQLADSLQEHREGDDDIVCDASDELPKRLPYVIVQNPEAKLKTYADKYFGPGTVENIKIHLDSLSEKDTVDAVFVNAILTGVQQRNLERVWGKPVLDRVGLIIEIFNAHAKTKEAKLQAELAALIYKKTRLVRIRGADGRLAFGADGEAEVVSGRGRGSGGRGFISGAGETELQLQRRRILQRKKHLLGEIEEVQKTRALHRAARRRHGGSYYGRHLPTIAVVGYTNAGKSSLVSALSHSYLYSDDKLFATLDPRVRKVMLPSGRKVLLSDTVGFISDLPIQLVEAFHATLEEVTEADLLMHVIDSSAPNSEDQRDSVLDVLEQIGVSPDKLENMIEVWNKVDKLQSNADNNLASDSGQTHYAEISSDRTDDSLLLEPEICEDSNIGDQLSISSGDISLENEESDVDNYTGISREDFQLSAVNDEDHSYDAGNHIDLAFDPVVGRKQKTSSKKAKINWSSDKIVHVKTSAIRGVGLHELLYLLDSKLNQDIIYDTKVRDEFNVKWRPPRKLEA